MGVCVLRIDKWYGIMLYTKSKSTKPTNKLILSMTINQYIVSCLAQANSTKTISQFNSNRLAYTGIYSIQTHNRILRAYNWCLPKSFWYTWFCESKVVKIVFKLNWKQFIRYKFCWWNYIEFHFICFGWLDCDVLIKTTGWISILFKLFTSTKLKLNRKQLVLHFWQTMECLFVKQSYVGNLYTERNAVLSIEINKYWIWIQITNKRSEREYEGSKRYRNLIQLNMNIS